MLVRDAMTEDLVTVEADATLRRAVERMLREGVGSVVVTRDGEPSGIVTETDALTAGYRSGRPFEEIPVSKVANGPLTTIPPTTTVRKAVRRMREAGVKKLPVVEGMELVGILTVTDVVRRQGDLIDEALRLDDQRRGWALDED